MDVGIVGGAGAGRTTVFRALLAHRTPQAAGGRHGSGSVGAIQVRDPRLERLAERFKPRKVTPIEIRVHDLCPSLEPSFPTAEIEGMKRMDVLLLVIPAFADASAEASVAELDRLVGELALEDLAFVEKRLAHASRDRLPELESEALERARAALDADSTVYGANLTPPQRAALRGFSLVTDRAFLALRNVAERDAGAACPEALERRAQAHGMPLLQLAAALESELAALAADERGPFLAEYGIAEPAGAALTRALLAQANIISFYTVGDDECRAWAISRGTRAREAAGKVHSDMERGFIRAEVIGCDELAGLADGLAEARRRGLLRIEGKDYEVRDGEIVHFRFNV